MQLETVGVQMRKKPFIADDDGKNRRGSRC